ncbi:Uncharacterised protein [Actinobaculum suis]|uniref:ABC-2 type transport system permease protein n=1 Tax=Actinobaculum suis TaxID=1657 RepID=A0A7Z9C9A0_9ACTO|nr:hypothetical protein [Actinobaculum suis]VDG76122.1 Uncharacterised protein [Actinobaculum suis]
MHRFFLTAWISLRASTAFATVFTALVTFIVMPLLSIAFNVLLGDTLNSPDVVRIMYASATLSAAAGTMAGYTSEVVRARDIEVVRAIQPYRRIDVAFWLGICVTPVILSLCTCIVSFGAATLFALSGGNSHPRSSGAGTVMASGETGEVVASSARLVPDLWVIILLILSALFIGLCLGIFAAGLGINRDNPYAVSNVLDVLLTVTSGVVVPYALYPVWLQKLLLPFPMHGTIDLLDLPRAGSGDRLVFLVPWLLDIAVALVCAGIGLAAFARLGKHLREGRVTSAI